MVMIYKKIKIFIFIFFICIVLKTLACLVPGSQIQANIESSSVGQRLGWNYVTLPISTSDDSRLDYFTECMYLNVCILSDTSHPFLSAIENYGPILSEDSPYYDRGGAGKLAGLLEGETIGIEGKPVYWFGVITFLRPLLTILTYDQVIALVQMTAYMLWAGAFLTIYRTVGLFPAFSFIFTLLLININAGFMLICTVMPFIISFVHMIYIPRLKNKDMMMNSLLITGMLTAYFDWFSTPIITFTYPVLMICMILYGDGILSDKIGGLKVLVSSSLHWVIGYGGINIAKWCLTSAVLQKNILSEGMTHVHGDMTKPMITNKPDHLLQYIYETFRNSFRLIKIVDYFPWKAVMAAGCLFFLLMIILTIKDWNKSSLSVILSLSALAPLAWLIVFHGHMFVHPHFTYRNFGPFLWGILLFFYFCPKKETIKSERKKY